MPSPTSAYSPNAVVLEECHTAIADSFHPTPRKSRSRLVYRGVASDLVKLNLADARVGDGDFGLQRWTDRLFLLCSRNLR
jgi:hypothetical protein